ncbi:hypothetical protein OSI75_23865, partial [Mycobacterium ulcerans]
MDYKDDDDKDYKDDDDKDYKDDDDKGGGARKVVVVDDEKPIADILEFNLKKEGYDVYCAYDGNDAVDL